MLPFLLYFVTGLVTGYHVYTLMFAAYGAPTSPLEFISLLGSFCLVIAAYLSLFKPYAASRVALLAALAIWCFYGPAIAGRVRTRRGKPVALLQRRVSLDVGTSNSLWLPPRAEL
jgi:uncharacterized membrane protein